LSTEDFSRLHANGSDPGRCRFVLGYAAGPAIKTLAQNDRHLMLGQHLAQDLFGHRWLEGPHGVIAGVIELACLALFVLPGGGLIIVLFDPAVEFATNTPDHGLVARVGESQTARS